MASARSRDAETTTSQGKTQQRERTRERSMNGTLDGWVEPVIATKPSFEDHGGAAYGVMEHMQPLGEPPSARVRARVKGEGMRKSMLGRSAASTGLDAQETPESTPVPAAPQAQAELEPVPNIVIDDDNDDDYAPDKKSKKKERTSKVRAPKRQSASARASTGPSSKKAKRETQREKNSRENYEHNRNRVYGPEKLHAVVEEAKRRAHVANKPELATAVNEIYIESLTDLHLTELLEFILTQTATDAQTKEFQGYVRRMKKKLRAKAAKEKAERDLPAEANGSKPLPLRSPSNAQQSTSAGADNTIALPSTERPEMSKAKLSIKVKSPSKSSENRHSTHDYKKSTSPTQKQPDDADDLSDLSELTELSEGEDMAADTPEVVVATSAGASPRNREFQSKDHAAERGSLGTQNRNIKRSSAEADFQETEDDRALAAKKQKLSGAVTREYDYQESSVRSSLSGQPRIPRTASARAGGVMPPQISLQPNAGENSAMASRANSTDVESPLTSPALSSRCSTPHAWKGPSKPTGKRAKTKTSPDKRNQAAFTTGVPGPSGAGRHSPIGDDDNEESSENNDFCSSCGGSGYLLCCDGCDRSFHFTCLDPPLSQEASELNEPWFCFVCVGKRPLEQPEKAARGLFAPLLNDLNKFNPRTFALPQDLRDHFEGVSTGKNGEFLEVVKPKARHRAGIDERPDDFKLKDSKGNPVLCYSCGKSSLGKRAIISCDHGSCGQNWHLDCLDPPLANPPGRDALGTKVGDWMCPLHVDHDLRRVDARLLAPQRTIHIRRSKQAKTVATSLRRGLHNNGIIEVVDDDSDDSESEFYEVEDNSKETPVVYQMPAKGIIQDFIHQIKQKRFQHLEDEHASKRPRVDAKPAAPSQLQQANFARRSIRDQQTALSLAQFANANQDLELGPDRVENLVGALIAEAPAAVVDGIAAAEEASVAAKSNNAPPPSPPNSDQVEQLSIEQRRELEALQELIKRKLEGTIGMKT